MIPDQLENLRALRARARAAAVADNRTMSFAQRAADAIAIGVGSWPFVLVQSALLIGWLVFNSTSPSRVDPYPFILLNLLLSFQAAYTAPIILMSQNRQSEVDRQRAVEDFAINQKAELEIETLHQKVDLLREQEIARLSQTVERLAKLLEERT